MKHARNLTLKASNSPCINIDITSGLEFNKLSLWKTSQDQTSCWTPSSFHLPHYLFSHSFHLFNLPWSHPSLFYFFSSLDYNSTRMFTLSFFSLVFHPFFHTRFSYLARAIAVFYQYQYFNHWRLFLFKDYCPQDWIRIAEKNKDTDRRKETNGWLRQNWHLNKRKIKRWHDLLNKKCMNKWMTISIASTLEYEN